MWFIGVEVEQETSAPPPKKNPGSAPAPLNRPSKYNSARTRKIALKYKVKQRKMVNFLPDIRLAQLILKRKFPSVGKPLPKPLQK